MSEEREVTFGEDVGRAVAKAIADGISPYMAMLLLDRCAKEFREALERGEVPRLN